MKQRTVIFNNIQMNFNILILILWIQVIHIVASQSLSSTEFAARRPEFDMDPFFSDITSKEFDFDTVTNDNRSKRESLNDKYDFDYDKSYQKFLKENFDELKPYLTKTLDNNDSSDKESETDYENDDGNENNNGNEEHQTQESKKSPKYCTTFIKKGKTCTACRNPKTNAKSESCSYSSKPSPKKYAYQRQSNYDKYSPDEEKETDYDEDDTDDEQQEEEKVNHKKAPKSPKRSRKHASNKLRSKAKPKKAKILPRSSSDNDYVEKVIEHIKQKDFSNCKRSLKNGLTCYRCKDKHGTNNEECVFESDVSDDDISDQSDEQPRNDEEEIPKRKPHKYNRPAKSKNVKSPKNRQHHNHHHHPRHHGHHGHQHYPSHPARFQSGPLPEDNFYDEHSLTKRSFKRMIEEQQSNDDEPSGRQTVQEEVVEEKANVDGRPGKKRTIKRTVSYQIQRPVTPTPAPAADADGDGATGNTTEKVKPVVDTKITCKEEIVK